MSQDLARESKFQWLARFGFLTRGLLYIVIATLVIGSGRTEDLTGVMEYLSHDFGRWLMIFMIAGLTGYGACATPRSAWTAGGIIQRLGVAASPQASAGSSIFTWPTKRCACS